MPTGYTVVIEEKSDLTLREFALRCARAMGACVMQRDDAMGVLPEAPEPDDYYEKSRRTAEAKLVELRGLSTEGKRALWQADCERIAKANLERVAKASETRRRYARMRTLVEAWKPPTRDHVGLRHFMLDQIDACSSEWKAYTVQASATPDDWYTREVEATEWSLELAVKNVREELQRAEERKVWIATLYASLDM